MKKFLIIISLLLFLHIYCDYITFDGSKLISLSYAPNQDYNAEEPVSIDNFSQDMISYYSWFASYGYCSDSDIPLICCQNFIDFFSKKWTIVSKSSIDKFNNYNYVLWRNDEYKKYILAFPGTRDIFLEFFNEAINTKLVDYNGSISGVKLVNQFQKVTEEIKTEIFSLTVLDDIISHPGYQFISTGHSLGGSIAALFLYEAVNKNVIIPEINEPVLITFGMPRTGNENFVIDFNSKIKNVIRVVRNGDIITSLPYSIINNQYRHLGGLVLVNKEMTSMNYCPKDIGEDYPDKECISSTSIDYKYHTNYFNHDTLITKRCRE